MKKNLSKSWGLVLLLLMVVASTVFAETPTKNAEAYPKTPQIQGTPYLITAFLT